MGVMDVLLVSIGQNVSFVGKAWWMPMLVVRLLLLLLAGFTLFDDEQERFICDTVMPGCSNVCFDAFAPVSVFRLWLFHLVLLCLPHVLFATYVVHKVMSRPGHGGAGSPFSPENWSSPRELSLHKAPLGHLPRFYCAYCQALILRILLEAVFGASQFFLFGVSVPKSFLCFEAPCTTGVECYTSRRTEKTLMLNFMLAVAAVSVVLSLCDLARSMTAMVAWRKRRGMLGEEMSKGEQSSVFTATTMADDGNPVSTRRLSLNGGSKNDLKEEKLSSAAASDGGRPVKTKESDRKPDGSDPETDAPTSTRPPTQFLPHSNLRPPLSPCPDRRPPSNPRASTPTPTAVRKPGPSAPAGPTAGQQSDGGDSQDRKAWV